MLERERGDLHEHDEQTSLPSGPQLRAQLCVMAIVTAAMAVWVCTRIASAHPSSPSQCVLVAIVPALLTFLSIGLFLLAHELGHGGWGPGRGGEDPEAPPRGPSGGLDVDWEQFERDFQAYAERQYVTVGAIRARLPCSAGRHPPAP
ncbi:MAG TPA: hypothetical protein VMU39_01080 [Solirubrobacteraceae bacterium]|nr:hypothetical protein [Solirubrobacteraceae bacterium]